MDIGLITALLFIGMMIGLIMGLPITFVLGGIAVLFTFFLWGPYALSVIPLLVFGKGMMSFGLIAIPLFVLMGTVLQESGLADRLFGVMHQWGGRLGGGLAVAAVLVCTMFAAMTGIGGAGTVTMGLIALPAMLARNYDKRLALGAIAASGALGILIPPSVIFIIYGIITRVSVGRLFAGGLFPGLILSILYITYILVTCKIRPEVGPALSEEELLSWKEKIFALKDVLPAAALILVVLGSIFGGVCTPSEGAAIGAAGSLVCFLLYAGFNWQALARASYSALKVSAMCMWIVFGAYAFATTYTALGAVDLVRETVLAAPFGYWGIFILAQVMFFILGMLLDPGAIIMITAPIIMPIVYAMGYDPVWFGVIFCMNMQMAYISPPFGYSLFYLKGIAPKGIVIGDIYRGIVPFLGIQAIGLVIVAIFPWIALWFPNLVFGI